MLFLYDQFPSYIVNVITHKMYLRCRHITIDKDIISLHPPLFGKCCCGARDVDFCSVQACNCVQDHNSYRPQTSFAEVMFLQVSVCPQRGMRGKGGICGKGGMCGRGVCVAGGQGEHAWQGLGACMAGRAYVVGGMHGRGHA